MKTLIKSLILACFLMIVPLLSNIALADGPPAPPGSHDAGGNTPPAGNGAPIDGGLSILLTLATGFGIKKIYDLRKNQQKD